jgi:hypothetical protein
LDLLGGIVNVYECIAAVSRDMAERGISKDRRNQQQGYSFRGIDDMYNALAMPMARHGLVVMPRVLSRECVERQTAKGSALFYVTVAVEFDFVSAKDGTKHTVKTYGEAMDSADKATNKAMSAAYKYAVMQVFCIPTEGDNDADATTHEVAPNAETALILDSLREAALDGIEALQARFRAIPKGAALSAVWAAHGDSLKATAAKVPA